MLGGRYRLSRDNSKQFGIHETQGAAREMNKNKIALMGFALSMVSMAAQTASWAINHSRSCYSYPMSTKRITGHAKINRAAKKRRASK